MTTLSLSSVYKICRSALRGILTYVRRRRKRIIVLGLRLYYGSKIRLLLLSEHELSPMLTTRDVIVRVGGKSAFRRIRKLIRRAKATIAIQMFIWKDDETGRAIAQYLLDAARRGVRIHIKKEPLGDFFELDESFFETKYSTSPLWRAFWNEQNITVDTEKNDDHTKMWIFDGRIVLLSGMNIGNEYEHTWHDFLVELRGDRYVHSILNHEKDISPSGIRIVMNDDTRKGIRPCVVELITNAEESIVVEHCYFTDQDTLSALASATKRGITVTILTPKNPDVNARANRAALADLGRKSDPEYLSILEYPTMFHAKVLLIDGVRCLIGSANFNTLSLDRTGEVCVLFTKRSRAVRKIDRRLQLDILRSRILGIPKIALVSRLLGKLGL